jgi:hypothetical protein
MWLVAPSAALQWIARARLRLAGGLIERAAYGFELVGKNRAGSQ